MHKRLMLGLAALTLTAAGQDKTIAPPTQAEIKEVADGSIHSYEYQGDPLVGWRRALKAELKNGSIDKAAAALGSRFGLSTPQMRELVTLWIINSARSYAFSDKTDEADAVHARFVALIRASHHAPLVVQAAASTFDGCKREDFDKLLDGARDRAATGWTLAAIGSCGEWDAAIAGIAPDKAVPIAIGLVMHGNITAADALPLYEWLLEDAQLAHVDAAHREAMAIRLERNYLRALFEAGLTDRAVARFEGLAPERRMALLREPVVAIAAQADGFALDLHGDLNGEIRRDDRLGVQVAAAYALAGRNGDAAKMLEALDLAGARRAFDCAGNPQGKCDNRRDESLDADLVLIDHLLRTPGDDPYLIAETFFAGSLAGTTQGPRGEVRCRLLEPARFGDICDWSRKATAADARGDIEAYRADESKAAATAVAALQIPGFAERKARFDRERAAAVARLGENPVSPPAQRWQRETIAAEPPPFALAPLPDQYRTGPKPAAEWPKGFAPLPEGYNPVRVSSSGTRAVAISVSGNYDPSGEISAGGYWVHLSEDGGKTWQRPRYTGLAEHFPYVVVPDSRMPLLAGDKLTLEVEIAELDTASITYPPVGLRTRRREKNLFLTLPLADLSRDSDGDGLTDLAAHHLLLDQPAGPGGTPYIVGSTRDQCRTPPSPEKLAIMALLERLFSVQSRAIVEPVDRAPGAPVMSGWRGSAESNDRPVFLLGSPADYACLNPDRLMIVYGEDDIARINRMTPDFHAVSLPQIVYNRARDRGYVKWSTGWAGGTFRLTLVNGKWQFASISEWIT